MESTEPVLFFYFYALLIFIADQSDRKISHHSLRSQ